MLRTFLGTIVLLLIISMGWNWHSSTHLQSSLPISSTGQEIPPCSYELTAQQKGAKLLLTLGSALPQDREVLISSSKNSIPPTVLTLGAQGEYTINAPHIQKNEELSLSTPLCRSSIPITNSVQAHWTHLLNYWEHHTTPTVSREEVVQHLVSTLDISTITTQNPPPDTCSKQTVILQGEGSSPYRVETTTYTGVHKGRPGQTIHTEDATLLLRFCDQWEAQLGPDTTVELGGPSHEPHRLYLLHGTIHLHSTPTLLSGMPQIRTPDISIISSEGQAIISYHPTHPYTAITQHTGQSLIQSVYTQERSIYYGEEIRWDSTIGHGYKVTPSLKEAVKHTLIPTALLQRDSADPITMEEAIILLYHFHSGDTSTKGTEHYPYLLAYLYKSGILPAGAAVLPPQESLSRNHWKHIVEILSSAESV